MIPIDFSGKTALVTGAGTGIGAAIATGLGRAGAHVVVHYNRSADGARAVERTIIEAGGSAETLQADVTDIDAAGELVETVVQQRGGIDILVNNAGDMVRRANAIDIRNEDFYRIIDLNLTSVFAICRAAVPHMQRAGGGAIINLSSVGARTGGGGGSSIYCTAKGGISTYTRGLAREVALDGIRVNAISPGLIETAFHKRNTRNELMDSMVQAVPMGRQGVPADLVGAALFLASDELSGYITGQILEVNGGQWSP